MAEAIDMVVAHHQFFGIGQRDSDLIITCGNDTYIVHKAVVCNRPEFFDRAIRFPVGGMYEIVEKYAAVGLKAFILKKFSLAYLYFWKDESFPKAAYHAPTTTPENDGALRNAIYKTISEHMELMKDPEIETLPVEFKYFSVRLLRKKNSQHR
ncbi:hypothetical protein CC78DRAFT_567866 [Lojkania enalia]|uniref:BTB domain-containing protein n=1 Tax=Lojkania enalia TaxID=147567 RepID=A0A9P4KFE6_9PLEO|nr:hypothetical protein CC78DRAFT_567866 [Didymosphaeria enalia]